MRSTSAGHFRARPDPDLLDYRALRIGPRRAGGNWHARRHVMVHVLMENDRLEYRFAEDQGLRYVLSFTTMYTDTQYG